MAKILRQTLSKCIFLLIKIIGYKVWALLVWTNQLRSIKVPKVFESAKEVACL